MNMAKAKNQDLTLSLTSAVVSRFNALMVTNLALLAKSATETPIGSLLIPTSLNSDCAHFLETNATSDLLETANLALPTNSLTFNLLIWECFINDSNLVQLYLKKLEQFQKLLKDQAFLNEQAQFPNLSLSNLLGHAQELKDFLLNAEAKVNSETKAADLKEASFKAASTNENNNNSICTGQANNGGAFKKVLQLILTRYWQCQELWLAFNWRENCQTCFGHSELYLLAQASAQLLSRRLNKYHLIVNLEPCLMCAASLISAQVAELTYLTPDLKAGAVQSKIALANLPFLNHQLLVSRDATSELAAINQAIIKRFFQDLRSQNRRLDRQLGGRSKRKALMQAQVLANDVAAKVKFRQNIKES